MSEQDNEKKNNQKEPKNNHRSLVSRLFHGTVDSAEGAIKRGHKGIKEGIKAVGKTMAKGVGKAAAGLGVSNSVIAAIASSFLGTLGFTGISFFDVIKNDNASSLYVNAWTCDQDELQKITVKEGDDEDLQENINIIYDLFVNELGYSEEFVVGMVSCMMVESHCQADRIESDYILTAEKEAFDAACGPGVVVTGDESVQAMLDYAQIFKVRGGWNGNLSGYTGHWHGAEVFTAGLGLIAWTADRAVEVCQMVDCIRELGLDYSCMDLQYQLAYLVATINEQYPTMKPDSGELGNSDAECTKAFFKTMVSGGSLSKVANRLDYNAEVRGYVDAAAANSQFTGDITSMAAVFFDSELEGSVRHNATARLCLNEGTWSTDSLPEAALSVAWLEGGHYADVTGVENQERLSDISPQVINDEDYYDGFDNNPGGKFKDMWACTEWYVIAHLLVLPGETGLNGKAGYFSSCDRGTCVPIRMAGCDDTYPAGDPNIQLKYSMGGSTTDDRLGESQKLWDNVGFFRGSDLYMYSGTSTLAPGTVMISWNVGEINGWDVSDAQGTQTINIPSDFDPVNARYAPSRSFTHDHIILYVGENAVRKWYGDDWLFNQWNVINHSAVPAAANLVKGDYQPLKEETDVLRDGNEFKTNHAGYANDEKHTFYTEGRSGHADDTYDYKMSAGRLQLSHYASLATSVTYWYNNKTGLRLFKSWSEIERDISNNTMGGFYEKVNSANPYSGTNSYDSWVQHYIVDAEYHEQQYLRFLDATQMCSYPVEEDADIIQITKDGAILGNTYMIRRTGKDGAEPLEEDPSTYKYYHLNGVASNDMLQDLITTYSNKRYTTSVTPYDDNNYQYGLTKLDGELIKLANNNAYDTGFKYAEEDYMKDLTNWVATYNPLRYIDSANTKKYIERNYYFADANNDGIYNASLYSNDFVNRRMYFVVDMNGDGNYDKDDNTIPSTTSGDPDELTTSRFDDDTIIKINDSTYDNFLANEELVQYGGVQWAYCLPDGTILNVFDVASAKHEAQRRIIQAIKDQQYADDHAAWQAEVSALRTAYESSCASVTAHNQAVDDYPGQYAAWLTAHDAWADQRSHIPSSELAIWEANNPEPQEPDDPGSYWNYPSEPDYPDEPIYDPDYIATEEEIQAVTTWVVYFFAHYDVTWSEGLEARINHHLSGGSFSGGMTVNTFLSKDLVLPVVFETYGDVRDTWAHYIRNGYGVRLFTAEDWEITRINVTPNTMTYGCLDWDNGERPFEHYLNSDGSVNNDVKQALRYYLTSYKYQMKSLNTSKSSIITTHSTSYTPGDSIDQSDKLMWQVLVGQDNFHVVHFSYDNTDEDVYFYDYVTESIRKTKVGEESYTEYMQDDQRYVKLETGDKGIWCTHASRGDRGVKCHIFSPAGMFGGKTNPHMQYMLFINTQAKDEADVDGDGDRDEPYIAGSGSGVQVLSDYYNEDHRFFYGQGTNSRWKALVDAYVQMEENSRGR